MRRGRSKGDEQNTHLRRYPFISRFGETRGWMASTSWRLGRGARVFGSMLCILAFSGRNLGKIWRPIWSPPTPCWKNVRLLSFLIAGSFGIDRGEWKTTWWLVLVATSLVDETTGESRGGEEGWFGDGQKNTGGKAYMLSISYGHGVSAHCL